MGVFVCACHSVCVCQSVCVGGCRRFVLSTVPIFVVCHTPYALKMNEVGSITVVVELVREIDRPVLLDCLLVYVARPLMGKTLIGYKAC